MYARHFFSNSHKVIICHLLVSWYVSFSLLIALKLGLLLMMPAMTREAMPEATVTDLNAL